MTKKVDTWMPLLVDKYLGDTTHLTTEQHGAYLLLLLTMWKRDGCLPADDAQLAAITRLGPARWKVNKPMLWPFFQVEGDLLTQKRLSAELQRAKKVTAAKSEVGAKGAAKRWKKDGSADASAIESGSNEDGTGIATEMATGMANGCLDAWQTDAPIPIPTQPDPSEKQPPPASREAEAGGTAAAGTQYGLIARELRKAGVGDASPTTLRFRTLVDAGATAEEFLALVPQALKVGDRPFAYLLGAVEGERKRAARTAGELHRGPLPGIAATVPSDDAERTAEYLRERSKPFTPEEKAAADEARKRVMAAVNRSAA